MPAFNIYLWLITTASAGNSLKVGLYNLDANTEISSWNIFRKNYAFLLYSFCKKIANESLGEIREVALKSFFAKGGYSGRRETEDIRH